MDNNRSYKNSHTSQKKLGVDLTTTILTRSNPRTAVNVLTWQRTCGLPTTTSKAWARVIATLNLLGLLRKPTLWRTSTPTNDSFERTCSESQGINESVTNHLAEIYEEQSTSHTTSYNNYLRIIFRQMNARKLWRTYGLLQKGLLLQNLNSPKGMYCS